MRRILFLHQVSSVGGGSYCMLALLKAVDKSKFEPIVILKQNGPLADEILKLGIEVHFFPQMATIPYNRPIWKLGSVLSYIRSTSSQRTFYKLLRALNIDIVYLNNMMLYPYLKTAKKCCCKTVMHVREHWPKAEHQKQMYRARRYAYEYADHLIAINHFSASMFPECKDKITIVYDWIDFSDRYEPISFAQLFGEDMSGKKVFLFTGGGMKIKGALEVFKVFSENMLEKNYRLLVLGNLPENESIGGIAKLYYWFMRIFRREKNYNKELKMIVENDSRIMIIPATYKIKDIFRQCYCMLSYFTMPHANLALAEAVCLGTVAIAANTEEAVEYSKNGHAAVLFDIRNRNDFLMKIRYVEDNYDVIKKSVMCNSEDVKRMFDLVDNATKVNEVLQRL